MTTNRAQEFKIDKAIISAEHLGSDYDVKSYVLELSLFEDIELPYLSGQIICMDDMGSFDEMNLKGTETIRIKVSGTEPGYEGSFELTMNIVSIVRKIKTTERTDVLHLNLVSPLLYRDNAIKVSKSYAGKPNDIAAFIAKGYLDVDVSTDYIGRTGGQASMKVIPPLISPLESVKWLIDRTTTSDGVPFYCWQSIYEQSGKEKIRFGNLDFMMTMAGAPAWNENSPLVFSPSAANSVALEYTADQAFVLKSFEANRVSDNLAAMADAAIGTSYTSLDTFTSQEYTRHFGVNKLLETVKPHIMRGPEQEVHDADMTLTARGETKKLDEHDHRHITQISSFGTYGSWNSYHDDPQQLFAMNKVRSNSLRSLLYKNSYNFTAAGAAFFGPMAGGGSVGVGAGDVTKLRVFRSDTSQKEPEVDEVRSGHYMITQCRHVFSDTTHTVAATIAKYDRGSKS